MIIRWHGAQVIATKERSLKQLQVMNAEGWFAPGIATADIYARAIVVWKVDGLVLVVEADDPRVLAAVLAPIDDWQEMRVPLGAPKLGGTRPWIF